MLHALADLIGGKIQAIDGDVGEIRSFYFDEREWVVRYLLVETSPWFNSRDILLSLDCFKDVDWKARTYPVNLTKEMVRKSPAIDTGKLISRYKEEEIVQYYGWQEYWNVRTLERRPMAGTQAGHEVAVAVPPQTPVLRNTREVFGYAVRATDGELGTVSGFIVDDVCWQVRYAVIDTGTWMPGKRVLVAPERIASINWEEADISLNLTREQIKEAPEYDPRQIIDQTYEDKLCRYYGAIAPRGK
jgi:hypothetical protein